MQLSTFFCVYAIVQVAGDVQTKPRTSFSTTGTCIDYTNILESAEMYYQASIAGT